MEFIIDFYLTIAAVQLGFIVNNNSKSIIINIHKYPNEELLEAILQDIDERAIRENRFNISHECEDYSYMIDDGSALEINIPEDIIELKIKDKLDEKLAQFNDEDYNFVVIDVSMVTTNMDILCDFVRDYYEYTENKVIWGTILFRRKWLFDENGVRSRIEVVHQANPNKDSRIALDLIQEILFDQGTSV